MTAGTKYRPLSVSVMDFFENSNHNKGCIYSSIEETKSLRRKANENYSKHLLEATTTPSLSEENLITTEEEELLLSHFISKIAPTCSYFKMPPLVAMTARWILYRYSFKHSWMEWDPKHVMLASILLASKCENLHLTADVFPGKLPNTNLELLLQLEFVLLAALDYNLHFFSPVPSLLGAAIALQLDVEQVKTARASLDRITATEAILCFRPSSLALAALKIAGLLENPRSFSLSQPDNLDDIVTFCTELTFHKIDPEKVKSIDRKLIQLRKSFGKQ